MKQALHRLDEFWARVESGALFLVLFAMLFLSFSQVLLRNLFSLGWPGADVLSRHLVLWIAMIGASLATHYHQHISIEAVTRFLAPAWKSAARRLVFVSAGLVSAALLRAALSLVRLELELGEKLLDGVPVWAVQLVMPVCLGVMALRFFLYACGVLPEPENKAS